MQVAQYVQELIWDDNEIEGNQAFYKCKEKFGGMPGLKKDEFISEVFDRTKEEFLKPLNFAGYRVAKEEAELKDEVLGVLKEINHNDPDVVRELLQVCNNIRNERHNIYIAGLKDSLDHLDDDLRKRLAACWPQDLGENGAD
jgi:hypothetical protein